MIINVRRQIKLILINVSIFLFFIANSAAQSQIKMKELIASTFLGGNASDGYVYDIDQFSFLLHPNGDIYLCGSTESNDFPISLGAFQSTYAGGASDSFIARLSANLGELKSSTFIGGTGNDIITDMLIDEAGDIYVCGYTSSEDIPVSANAYDTSYNDASPDMSDVFVSVFNASLDSLKYSTYLGGSLPDGRYHNRLRMDIIGNLVITGGTMSLDFPITDGALFTNPQTGYNEIFLSVITPDLDSLLASTYFGGNAFNQVTDLMIDDENNIVLCGMTGAANFPITENAFDTSFNGEGDIFISKISNNLVSLLASTYVGGVGADLGRTIAFGPDGSIYIAGRTESVNFPTSHSAYDSTYNGGYNDAFVSCLSNNLDSLVYSTLLGGEGWDEIIDVLYDSISGEVFLSGFSNHESFPVTSIAYDSEFNGETDCIICSFNHGLDKLSASTFLGGYYYDFGVEMILSEAGNLLVCGNASSDGFPVTPGAYDESFNGIYDVFITEIDKNLSGLPVCTEEMVTSCSKEASARISLSPNPCQGETLITVSIDLHTMRTEGSLFQLRLFDPKTGRYKRILEKKLIHQPHNFIYDTRDLQAGYYLLQLIQFRNGVARQIAVQKLIKIE